MPAGPAHLTSEQTPLLQALQGWSLRDKPLQLVPHAVLLSSFGTATCRRQVESELKRSRGEEEPGDCPQVPPPTPTCPLLELLRAPKRSSGLDTGSDSSSSSSPALSSAGPELDRRSSRGFSRS